jgi:hypothetical protein
VHRVWQGLAIILGLVIIVIGGLTAYVFVTRTASQPPRPTAPAITPSPRPTAVASASGTLSPGPGASASGPSTTALPTPDPSGSPEPTSSGTTPTGPIGAAEFSVERVGLDDPAGEGALARTITITTHGPGEVKAAISDTTGGLVRLCLYKGDPAETTATPLCRSSTKGFVRGTATGATGTWTVVLTSAESGRRPVTTATVTYRTRTTEVELGDFRFQGTSDQPRNGFRVHVKARADGDAAVDATWVLNEDTQQFDHRVHIRDLTAGADVTDEAAKAESASAGGALKGTHEYQIDLRNTQKDAGGEVALDATVSWP